MASDQQDGGRYTVRQRVRYMGGARGPLGRAMVGLALCGALAMAGCAGDQPLVPSVTAGPVPSLSHIFVIVLENKSASDILGSSSAPYINHLAAQYGVATRYFAVSHPSLPNYIALTGGSTYSLDGTDCSVGPDCHVAGTNTNIADEIEAAGRTWVAYMESMPAPCTLTDADSYAVRHDPFVYYDDIRNGPDGRCASHVLPYDRVAFQSALATYTVPDFVWISPNLCDDGHDSCGGDAVAHTDDWLARNVPPILSSAAFQQEGVLFLTWDEGTSQDGCCGLGGGGGQVATLVISPMVRPGYRSSIPYDHYALLRTIEDGWGLGRLGNTAPATQSATLPMSDFFQQAGSG